MMSEMPDLPRALPSADTFARSPLPPIGRYTKRPVTIHAVRFDGSDEMASQILRWARGDIIASTAHPTFDSSSTTDWVLKISTLEGTMTAHAGDWVIKGTEGEFYPCKDSVFRAVYVQQAH